MTQIKSHLRSLQPLLANCKNLPKCTKFCSTRKLEVAAKTFDLLTKIVSCIGKYTGLKAAYQAIFVLYACIFELKFCWGTHVRLLAIGPQQSLLMIIKRIWDLNLFPSSLKESTSNFRISFVSSFVFNLRFKKFPNHRFFSDSAENPVNIHR